MALSKAGGHRQNFFYLKDSSEFQKSILQQTLKICICVHIYIVVLFNAYGVLPRCMSVHHVRACYLWRPKEAMGSPGTEVTGSCEWSCGCWEINPGPLEKLPMLLTVEPSLQAPSQTFKLFWNILLPIFHWKCCSTKLCNAFSHWPSGMPPSHSLQKSMCFDLTWAPQYRQESTQA